MNDNDHQRADFYAGLREERDAAMAEHDCPECGSIDGMIAVDRAGARACPGRDYYRRLDIQHDVFTPCPECNRARGIPPGYHLVLASYRYVWDSTPCKCPDCRHERIERMDNHAPADGDGRRAAERMYR